MASKYKRRIYCNFCDFFCRDPEDMVSHIEKKHQDMIPPDFSSWRFFYYLRTGKTEGKCIVCGKPTNFNEKTHKYFRFCKNPACKEKYKQTFDKRMIGKYGKTSLLDDPEQQRKMLANRKISGYYVWRDRITKTLYTGSYEKSFLEMLDEILDFDPNDVMAPSPHTYYYEYEGKTHFYIPDFYIPSLNLEIEIKDGGSNPNTHPKIVEVDKKKELLKDAVMKSNSNNFNYLKITDNNNKKFLEYLEEAKVRFINGDKSNIVMI